MGASNDTEFGIYKLDAKNARFQFRGTQGYKLTESIIEIGIETFTMETIIHEIAELETVKILYKFAKNKKNRVPNPIFFLKDGYSNRVAHFISPYGENSFMSPFIEDNAEEKLIE